MDREMNEEEVRSVEQWVRLAARLLFERQRIPQHMDAEDLIQEGWVGALQAWREFDPTTGVRFSRRCAKRIIGQMRDAIRNGGKRRADCSNPIQQTAMEEAVQEITAPDTGQVERVAMVEFIAILKTNEGNIMTTREHEVFCMRFFDSMDYPIIARKLGISEITCRRHIQNSRDKVMNKYPDFVGVVNGKGNTCPRCGNGATPIPRPYEDADGRPNDYEAGLTDKARRFGFNFYDE